MPFLPRDVAERAEASPAPPRHPGPESEESGSASAKPSGPAGEATYTDAERQEMIRDYLAKMFDGVPGRVYIGYAKPTGNLGGDKLKTSMVGRTYPTANLDSAWRYALSRDLDPVPGVYVRSTTLPDDFPQDAGKRRGKAEESHFMPALQGDWDLEGPGHKDLRDDNLSRPGSFDDLLKLLATASLPEPTWWVSSGGGFYPIWQFDQALDLTDSEMYARAERLSKALHEHVAAVAKTFGWAIDNTSDLARVYRLPGTTNRKVPGVPVVARVTAETGLKYTLADWEARAESWTAPRTAAGAAGAAAGGPSGAAGGKGSGSNGSEPFPATTCDAW
ncbi:hypothetical protein AB1484_38195 [Parafrankia sp. FMc6]|uniref:hypothetical protein n=1 Tax=Parafrankia soli TaxID=2599596 RepID=UPI0034D64F1F